MKQLKRKMAARLVIVTLVMSCFTLSGYSRNVIPVQSVSVAQAASFGQKNALAKAKSYLAYTAFSKKGLVKQLKYEGFSKKEANYGVKHCGANWKKQAVKKAKSYLDYSSFSKSGLLRQLKYEGFTTAQAKYGVKKAYK